MKNGFYECLIGGVPFAVKSGGLQVRDAKLIARVIIHFTHSQILAGLYEAIGQGCYELVVFYIQPAVAVVMWRGSHVFERRSLGFQEERINIRPGPSWISGRSPTIEVVWVPSVVDHIVDDTRPAQCLSSRESATASVVDRILSEKKIKINPNQFIKAIKLFTVDPPFLE